MAKHVSISRLSRLLQELAMPVYLLDQRQVLIFFNEALSDWVNCEANHLIGQVCRYHTPTSRMHHEIIAAALAPPPEVWQGSHATAVLAVDTIQQIRYRIAEFLPLPLADNQFGVLVFIASEDLPVSDAVALFRDRTKNTEVTALLSAMQKPFLFKEMQSYEALQAKELHQHLITIRHRQSRLYQLEQMLGNTPAMVAVRQQAILASKISAPVLIIGEVGTGREYLANAIHFGKDRDMSGGLIPIDCRALPQELIMSTMRAFYQRYAKEDRNKRHTLLLTEVDLIEPETGDLLAAIIANNPGNMRIIGTTVLEPACWSRHPQLPYQLGTIQICLPPLRKRMHDIPLLAQWFLEQCNVTGHSTDKSVVPQRTGFASDAIDLMMLYHWPGNLDELAMVVSEVHANATSTLVRKADLPLRLCYAADANVVKTKEETIDLEKFLQTIELELIQRALSISQSNKAKAARMLGMTRPRLYRRLEQLGLIDPTVPDFTPIDDE